MSKDSIEDLSANPLIVLAFQGLSLCSARVPTEDAALARAALSRSRHQVADSRSPMNQLATIERSSGLSQIADAMTPCRASLGSGLTAESTWLRGKATRSRFDGADSAHFLRERFMKNDIHPEMHPVVYIDPTAEVEFISRSTQTSGCLLYTSPSPRDS